MTVARTLRAPWRRAIVLAVLTPFARPAPSPQEPKAGDLLVSAYADSRIDYFAPDGTPRGSIADGPGAFWVGVAATPDGRLAVARRFPHGVNVFERDGTLVASFDTPEVTNANADLAVFADGTFAVCDFQGHSIELYDSGGSHVGSFTAPGMAEPWGSYMDASGELWVATDSGLWRFDRSGAVVGTLLTGSKSDVAVPGDGTLWELSFDGTVIRRDLSGALLSSFSTALGGGSHYGLAVSNDLTVYVTRWPLDTVFRFEFDGTPLPPIQLPAGSGPLFPMILDAPGSGFPYCTGKVNSLGCLPAIRSAGVPRASGDLGFTVSASNVRNAKPGLLLYTLSGRAAVPFHGGVLCLAPPVLRTPPRSSGGPPPPIQNCGGGWRIDMNAFAAGLAGGTPHPGLRVPGTFVHCQWWGRDPGDAFGSTLTDALQYEIAP